MIKSKKNILMGVIILLMSTTIFSGCVSESARKEKVVDLLHEKYKEEFEIIAYKDTGIFEDYYTVKAYCVNYPDLLFQAYVDIETENITDSYVTKRLMDRVSEKMSLNIGTLENDYFIFIDPVFKDTLLIDPLVSLEDYIKEMPENKYAIYLCIDRENLNSKNVVSSLIHMMDGISEMNGTLYIYLPDSSLMAQIQEYVRTNDDIYSDFDKMTKDAYIGFVDFQNGSLTLTEEKFIQMAGDLL